VGKHQAKSDPSPALLHLSSLPLTVYALLHNTNDMAVKGDSEPPAGSALICKRCSISIATRPIRNDKDKVCEFVSLQTQKVEADCELESASYNM
jgi:hypothetical protein